MKQTLAVLGLALCIAGTCWAVTAQQQKMKDCNAQATDQGLKGDERKIFMRDCLSAAGAGDKLTPQQRKMKTCNAEATAKGLKGEARSTFMSSCLSAQ